MVIADVDREIRGLSLSDPDPVRKRKSRSFGWAIAARCCASFSVRGCCTSSCANNSGGLLVRDREQFWVWGRQSSSR
jgi:hypothetical protein